MICGPVSLTNIILEQKQKQTTGQLVLTLKQIDTVSVIVPHYNDHENLFACIDSLVHQSLPQSKVEIIVVDDCSPRCAGAELKQRYPSVVYVRHKINKGPAAARNTGIALARGDLLAFIDSDATAPRHWLRSYVEAMNAGAEAACGSVFHEKNFLARMTALTAFGIHLNQRHGPRYCFAAANFSIRASTMSEFSFAEDMGFAGEDVVLSKQIVDDGRRIEYVARSWVLHKPPLSLRSYFKRALRYGTGFKQTRARMPSLPGYNLHRFLAGASGFALLPVRVLIDVRRAFKFRELIGNSWWDTPAVLAFILVTRIAWATGVAAAYVRPSRPRSG
jgi:glycosyltransferase involved in cell wall biosynthesis